jgi:hypothetical protein
MSDESVILVNLLKVKPGKQDALIAHLKQNTDTVIRTLPPGRVAFLLVQNSVYSQDEDYAGH